jgi:hypothetical protein
VDVGPEHERPRAAVPLEHRRRGMAEAVPLPGARHRHERPRRAEPRVGARGGAAVVRDLRDRQRHVGEQGGDLGLHGTADIARQDDGRRARRELEHHRVVVADRTPLPLRGRGMQHAHEHGALAALVAAPDLAPRRSGATRLRPQRLHQRIVGDAHPVPDQPRTQVVDDRRHAGGMVRVAVRDGDARQAAHAERPGRRRDDARPDVEAAGAGQAARVHQHRGAAGEPHQRRVPLPDVQERDPERVASPDVRHDRVGRRWRSNGLECSRGPRRGQHD